MCARWSRFYFQPDKMLFYLALALVLIALIFFGLARRAHTQTGLPIDARVVYADTGAWEKVVKPLYSKRYRLTGKPDYLLAEKGALIPVEVKPNRAAPAPLESDVMQLAAYGLLVEEMFGAPPYGLLKYRDAVYRIEMSRALREQLLAIVEEMRRDADARNVSRDHFEVAKCRACGYRAECVEALKV